MKFKYKCLLFLLLPLPGFAVQHLDGSPQNIEMTSKNSKQYITVTNKGDEKSFATISTKKLLNPGTPEQKIITNKNPKKLGLLVSPRRMIIKKGKKRKIKLVSINKNLKQDAIYLVSGSGAIPPAPKSKKLGKDDVGMQIQMGLGFEAVVIVRPNKLRPKLNAFIKGNHVIFDNTGNTTLYLVDVASCEKNGCNQIASILRIYPGSENKKLIPKLADKVTYKLEYPGYSADKTLSR